MLENTYHRTTIYILLRIVFPLTFKIHKGYKKFDIGMNNWLNKSLVFS